MAGRVLIVEDEMLVSMMLEDMLEELGYKPMGPVGQLETALEIAREAAFEAVILDVNLNGQASFPVADVLRRRGIPFLFATGYGSAILPTAFHNIPVLQKPLQRRELKRLLAALLE